MNEPKPIFKNGIRILRPWEYDTLISTIEKRKRKRKYKYVEIIHALLYTGMRYVELQRFMMHPDWFDKATRTIFLPKEASRKKKRTMKERYVYLSSQGVIHVEVFLRYVDNLPIRQGFDRQLHRFSTDTNLEGISLKTFRKTWESWLVVSYPTLLPLIAMSQGHTLITAMEHYLNLPFTKEDIEEIKIRTAGWSGLKGMKGGDEYGGKH